MPDPFLADAHNDLLLELVVRRHERNPFGAHWLPPLRAGGVRLQVVPIYGDPVLPRAGALRRAVAQVAAFQRALAENRDAVAGITRAGDIDALADCIVRVSWLAVDLQDRILELDINPLRVLEKGAKVVDALVVAS